jgi:hypothetical protein
VCFEVARCEVARKQMLSIRWILMSSYAVNKNNNSKVLLVCVIHMALGCFAAPSHRACPAMT